MLPRHLYKELNRWLNNSERKPLILMGARQVGKTTLVRKFATDKFRKLHEFNFEERKELRGIFEKNLDPQRIIEELSINNNQTIDEENDLVFFDEVQLCPAALTSLKYFCEKRPRLAICAAGSLLGISLSPDSFPVGKVDRLELFPINFTEYLEIVGEKIFFEKFAQYQKRAEIPQPLHDRIWSHFKAYLVTGGLPEIVSFGLSGQMSNSEHRLAIRAKQKTIIRDYLADMAKHSGKVNAMHIERIYSSVAEQVGSVNDGGVRRFKFKGVIPGISQYSRLASAFDWLAGASLILRARLVSAPQIPLSAYSKESLFKAYIFDVGILGALANLSPETILNYNFGTYKGFIAENFVAQELTSVGLTPFFFWEGKQSEIEFLIEYEQHVIPIEVKSGSRTRSLSLVEYRKKYSPIDCVIASAKPTLISGQVSGSPSMVPVYGISLLRELIR